jgi:hypothetical protein
MKNTSKVIFIMSHYYSRGYKSFTKYYVDNINRFYEHALIIITDNNSEHKNDIFDELKNIKNIILLDNDIECKFELGAYHVAIKYLIENNIVFNYDYCVCSQDNFVIKNVFDFNLLKINNIKACPINSWRNDRLFESTTESVLSKIGLYDDKMDETMLCWCISFVISTEKIEMFYNFIKHIVIKDRTESEASERYLGRILYELNGHVNTDIDGNMEQCNGTCILERLIPEERILISQNMKYNCFDVDVINDTIPNSFFVKTSQGKGK